MTTSAQQPGSNVSTRYIDVIKTCLQSIGFFSTFAFDSADELLAAVAEMQFDLSTMVRNRDLRSMYSGWLYWLLYVKGYLQYAESGTVGSGNVYFDYLTKYYLPRAHDARPRTHDAAIAREFADPEVVVERVTRRFRDVDFFGELYREHAGKEQGWLDRVAPVRVIVSDPPPDNPPLVYEVGSDRPLKPRLIDGWHRLFSAALFGIEQLRCEVAQEDRHLNHIRGAIEDFSFDGRRLVIRGWCKKADRQIYAVEVRVGENTVGIGSATNAFDLKNTFGEAPYAERSYFEIDCECYLSTDEPTCFRILPLDDWLPVGEMVAWHLPGMYNERDWPPVPLTRRQVNDSEPKKLAFRSVKCLYEMLMPLQRHRPLSSFTSVLDWGSGCGLLEVFRLHFLPDSTLVGVDVDEEAIEWCKQSGLPGEFLVVDRMPPTDLAPDYFDLALSYSALTHLTRDGQGAWLSEMHRVMKSGGYLVVGVYGELLRPFLTSPEILSELTSSGISDSTHNSRPESVDKAEQEHATYQTNAFTLREYSKWFEVVEYIEGGLNDLLDLVIMRKV